MLVRLTLQREMVDGTEPTDVPSDGPDAPAAEETVPAGVAPKVPQLPPRSTMSLALLALAIRGVPVPTTATSPPLFAN